MIFVFAATAILGAATGIGLTVRFTGHVLSTPATSRSFRPSSTAVLYTNGERLETAGASFFYRTPRERFMLLAKGPVELTGSLDAPAIFFQRQGGDGLWYNVEGYSVGGPAARVYDESAPLEGRPLTEETK